MARWKTHVFRFFTKEIDEEVYCGSQAGIRLSRSLRAWLRNHDETVKSFNGRACGSHLGYVSPSVRKVLKKAQGAAKRMESAVRDDQDDCLFFEMTRYLVPAGYAVVRVDGIASYYWLVGRGSRAVEVAPLPRLDPLKLLGWLGLMLAVGAGLEVLARLIGARLPGQGLPFFTWFSMPGLLTMISLASPISLVGLRRILRGVPLVRTVVILPVMEGPSTYLTCLAYLGAHVKRLTVVDRNYKHHLEDFLTRPRRPVRSASLTVESPDLGWLHLLEVPGKILDQSALIDAMLESCDGLVYLAETPAEIDELKRKVLQGASRPPSSGSLLAVEESPTASGEKRPLEQEAICLSDLRGRFVTGVSGTPPGKKTSLVSGDPSSTRLRGVHRARAVRGRGWTRRSHDDPRRPEELLVLVDAKLGKKTQEGSHPGHRRSGKELFDHHPGPVPVTSSHGWPWRCVAAVLHAASGTCRSRGGLSRDPWLSSHPGRDQTHSRVDGGKHGGGRRPVLGGHPGTALQEAGPGNPG